jgi:uncharacterized integral membrane protein (TIGR00697 family)
MQTRANTLFLVLAGFFIANTLIAEFIGVKIFSLEATLGMSSLDIELFGEKRSLQFTAGVLLWPVVFIMTDIINEYFGAKGVRFLSYLTAGLICYAFLMMYAAIHLAPAGWWDTSKATEGIPSMQAAYAGIMGQGAWIIVGSLVAFFVGQLVDVLVFRQIKKRTGEGMVWLRATGSTMISQLIDSFLVLYIAFVVGAGWSMGLFLSVGIVNYLYKVAVAILLTPVVYGVHYLIDSYLGESVANKLKEDAHELD